MHCHAALITIVHPSNTHYYNTEMQKDNFFTRARFEPKLFCKKKCVNYDKSTLGQNSVKGPKETNSANSNNIRFQNVLKMPSKRANVWHYSSSRQNSVKFCKDFTRDRIFLHKHCLHIQTFLHLCYNSAFITKFIYTRLQCTPWYRIKLK